MPKHLEKKTLPYSAKQLFDIVADVKSYPDFLPWTVKSKIFNQSENQFDAELIVGHKLIQTSYTSRVQLTPFERIDVNYISGPFEYLENYWLFKPLNNHQTEIEFFIDFHFKNSFFQKVADHLFIDLVKEMISCFEKQAKRIFQDQCSKPTSIL